jgi:hypothetical protein
LLRRAIYKALASEVRMFGMGNELPRRSLAGAAATPPDCVAKV